ncbi:MAG: 2-phosphosulfolactate phosphatase [Alicyclobacillaceae bacterium]|nr:2-phosphosulfolactate phosphatase [Alicyclobacillaceae bacterium]
MKRKVYVWTMKEQIDPHRLSGASAVVMDVLLATTTMITLMERGASAVFPVSSLEEARSLKRKWSSPQVITGGEEEGRPVPEFDFGPCPDEYSPEQVRGKHVIFLTTNGTRAVRRAEAAEDLLLASLRNVPAVADYLERRGREAVYLICAGSKGRMSLEDFLCAGLIASRLDPQGWVLDDAAAVAKEFAAAQEGRVLDCLVQGRVGKWFCENGRRDLLDFVAAVGASEAVVRVESGRLRMCITSSEGLS